MSYWLERAGERLRRVVALARPSRETAIKLGAEILPVGAVRYILHKLPSPTRLLGSNFARHAERIGPSQGTRNAIQSDRSDNAPRARSKN
jgi:hypothetical protein